MKATAMASLCVLIASGCSSQVQRPNIIYIVTDQQRESMMSCAGNDYLKTPAMDHIAHNGVRFTKAYVTNPVCSPSRVSMITGRMSGYFFDKNGNQVQENAGSMKIPEVSEEIKSSNVAAFLKKAGYDLAYGGKEHLPPSLAAKALGFADITDDSRDLLAKEAAQYIKGEHKNPFFLMVSFINPHDICFMAIRDHADSAGIVHLMKNSKTEMEHLEKALELPIGVSKKTFFAEYCPPLPPNFEPQVDEPKAIGALLDKIPFRKSARTNYTDEQWRMHRWAYCRLTEMVDAQIQVVLDALKQSGQEKNTLVILTSDHGDNDAAHRLEHKTVLDEESVHIPLVAMWKGHIPGGQVNEKDLVSIGLDLLPTVCDYAGIKGQADPRGKSLKPLFEGKTIDWRKSLAVESEIGRMVIRNDGMKYIRYDAVGIEERLMDLKKDPYEISHFTHQTSYSEHLSDMRKLFDEEWFPGLK